MKYKVDIWQYCSIIDTYECNDIEEAAEWYKSHWSLAYDNGLCAVEIYENGEDYPFDKAVKLGFY